MDNAKDIAIAVMGASIALGGLVLVFMGFVYVKGDALASRRGERFLWAAKAGLVPVVASLACAWACLDFLLGRTTGIQFIVWSFRAEILSTAIYATVVMLMLM